MKELYIESKVSGLASQKLNADLLDRVRSKQRATRVARLLNEEIEALTAEFHQKLCGYVYHVLDKEL